MALMSAPGMLSAEVPAILPLMIWLSPAYPVGAYAYSHGLETAVDQGLVRDAVGVLAWITDLFDHGSARQDAVLAAEAWRNVQGDGAAALRDLNALALALPPSRERRLETASMGRAFVEATGAAWPQAVSPALPAIGDIAYPVAFGSACGTLGLPLEASLGAYGLAIASNLVSAAVRLGPIGQTDGQRIIAGLVGPAFRLGGWAAATTLADLGACAFRSDIAALQHETLYSRLFRS